MRDCGWYSFLPDFPFYPIRPSFNTIRHPHIRPSSPYFFFASPKEKVTKRKATLAESLRAAKGSSTLWLWGNAIGPRNTCGPIGLKNKYQRRVTVSVIAMSHFPREKTGCLGHGGLLKCATVANIHFCRISHYYPETSPHELRSFPSGNSEERVK